MDAGLIDRIETGVERAAAALFGGAVGYAAYRWHPQPAAYAVAAAAFAYVLGETALKAATPRRRRFAVPIFDVRAIEALAPDELMLTDADRFCALDELLLTDADRVAPKDELLLTTAERVVPLADPLVLDDILAEIGPDSRVVHLFDRRAMPTPGQLKSRIDDHLGQGAPTAAPADASQALSEALAELRRSLR
jgi:hypothetical protein